MENWRQLLIDVIAQFGAPIPADPSDEKLLALAETVKAGRTWVCSTCDINLYPWEECCS